MRHCIVTRIVALVELCNVQRTAHSFLTTFVPIVDGIDVLHSNKKDATRTVILERNAMLDKSEIKLDIQLNKTN